MQISKASQRKHYNEILASGNKRRLPACVQAISAAGYATDLCLVPVCVGIQVSLQGKAPLYPNPDPESPEAMMLIGSLNAR